MNASARHFLRDGFEGTSLDRVAADARVSKQAIYASFRDKEDLFNQVVRANLTGHVAAAVPPGADVRTVLEAVATGLSESLFTSRNLGLFRANVLAMQRMPELAAVIRDYRHIASREIADVIEGQAAQGRIDCSVARSMDLGTRLGGLAVEGTRFFLGHAPPSPRQRALRCAWRWTCSCTVSLRRPSAAEPRSTPRRRNRPTCRRLDPYCA